MTNDFDAVRADLTSSEALAALARIEAALRVFADDARLWEPDAIACYGDDLELWQVTSPVRTRVTVADLRAAAARFAETAV